MTDGRYDIYGLAVSSQLALPGPVTRAPCDMAVVRASPCTVPAAPPSGEPVAEMVSAGRRWYTATADGPTHRLRFHGMMDVTVRPRRIEYRTDPDAEADLAAVLVPGTGFAFALAVAGAPVLHASAVELDGEAVAFLGRSGAGKSTVAAVACAGGARLVTDDVLRLTPDARHCWRGADRLRLRSAASWAQGLLSPRGDAETTADGRVLAAPPHARQRLLPLRALHLVAPDHSATRASVERLGEADAVAAIAASPRIFGWSRPQDLVREFRHQAAVARAVPVSILRLPWSDNWTGEAVRRIVEQIHEATTRPHVTT